MTLKSVFKKSPKPAAPDALSAPSTDAAPSASAVMVAAITPPPSPIDDEARIGEALAAAQDDVKRLATEHEEAALNAELAAPADAVAAEQALGDAASALEVARATLARLQTAKAAAGRAAARQRHADHKAAHAAATVDVYRLAEQRGEIAARIDAKVAELAAEYASFREVSKELITNHLSTWGNAQRSGIVVDPVEIEAGIRLSLRRAGFGWAIAWAGTHAIPSMADRTAAGNLMIAHAFDPEIQKRAAG